MTGAVLANGPEADARVLQTTGVEIVEAPEALRVIGIPNVAAAIWKRAPLAGFQRWIDGLDPALLPELRAVAAPQAVREVVLAACEAATTPVSPERERLIDDVVALAEIFGGIAPSPFQRIRLDVVDGDACRRFHVDSVKARLVCTYRGPGTQYGEGRPGRDPSPILEAPTGSPMIHRGSLWPAKEAPLILHRSPPISGSGLTRLVLVIDPLADAIDDV